MARIAKSRLAAERRLGGIVGASTDTEIVPDNINAVAAIYVAAMLEQARVFAVVDRLVELFVDGLLPVGRGRAGQRLYRYWRTRNDRLTEAERRSLYARTLGLPGGNSGAEGNREFDDLWLRFLSAVSAYAREAGIGSRMRNEGIAAAARELAVNVSLHGYGVAYFAAAELQKQTRDIIAILSEPEIRRAHGARDMWQVVENVARRDLGGAINLPRHRAMAEAGHTILSWLARHAASGRPTRRRHTSPKDADLVRACELWLAVTRVEDEELSRAAQPRSRGSGRRRRSRRP